MEMLFWRVSFQKHQFGVGYPNGLDNIVHYLKGLWASGHDIYTTDVRNAYNTISRKTLFDSIANKIPALLPTSMFFMNLLRLS